MPKIQLKDLSEFAGKLLNRYRESGKITLLHEKNLVEVDADEFLKQDADGMLYDLGHEYAYIVARETDPNNAARLVQDIAVNCVLHHLKKKLATVKSDENPKVCLFCAAKDLPRNEESIRRAKLAVEKLQDSFGHEEDVVEQSYHSKIELVDEGSNLSVWMTATHGLQQMAKDIMIWRIHYKYDHEIENQFHLITDRLPKPSYKYPTESEEVVAFTEYGIFPAVWMFETQSWNIFGNAVASRKVYGWIPQMVKDSDRKVPKWESL